MNPAASPYHLNESEITPSQRTAARIAGALYLLTMAMGIFGESYVRARLLVRGDAIQTATNILASERLFRIGIVCELITVVGIVVLLWALYVVLKPISSNVALLGAFLRLTESSIAAMTTLSSFAVLRLLSVSDQSGALDMRHLQTLARILLDVHGAGMRIAFVFVGLAGIVFSYLWFKSRYIPRGLAGWGLVSSLLLAIGTLLFMVFPNLGAAVGLAYMLPMGLYEVGLGLWLVFKGIRAPIVNSRPPLS